MISESGGRAVVIAPSALGSTDVPAGLSKIPMRRIRQAIYPPRRIRRRNVEEKHPWRVSGHDSLPRSPSMASGNEVWKTEGVSTFSLGVLVRGHGIHITPQVWWSLSSNSTKTQKQWNQRQRATTGLVNIQIAIHLTLGCLYNPFEKMDKVA